MAYAKQQEEWGRMGHLLVLIRNMFRDKGKRPVQPHEMIPPYFVDKQTETSEPDFYFTPIQLAQLTTKR